MKTLVGFEIRKIVKTKSFVIAFLVFVAIQIFVAFLGCMGNSYVNGEFLETHMERNRKDLANGRAMSGRKIDEALLRDTETAMNKVDVTSDDNAYMLTDIYQNEVRPYQDVFYKLQMIAGMPGLSVLSLSEEEFYERADQLRTDMYEKYGLSETEINYWNDKAAQLPEEPEYQYGTSYEMLVSMKGAYMTFMFLTFFLSVVMVNVFMVEVNQKTDQCVLCSRYGRERLYVAKLLAGIIVTLVVTMLFAMIAFTGNMVAYGWEGFHSSLQTAMIFWYPFNLSLGETYLIMLGILVLSAVLISLITMILSWVIRNCVFTVMIMVGGLFAARLIPIPFSWGLVSRLWNLIPINLLKLDQGFTDLRLFKLFGLELTSWQFAPVLFVLLGGCMFFVGKICFCQAQIKGR